MRRIQYLDFLKSKIYVAPETGFEISPEEVNPILKPHQRDAVVWAVKGGRRALFEAFGLGKTVQELEFCRIVSEREGSQSLITLPLGVKQEFYRDAVELLKIEPPEYVRTMDDIRRSKSQILLTNYERIRDGDIDPQYFKATTGLDEASVLRSFGSKTYQTFLDKFRGVPYKLVSTATPSPNKYKELIHYAGFLEIMDTGQALTRFFQRDSTKANNLTLFPHKEEEFWLWMSTWALFITKPSDLGYSDEGYDLPPLDVRYHEIPVDHNDAGAERDGQLVMIRDAAVGLKEAAREKRESIAARVAKAAEIVASSPDDHFILWHDLEDERHALKAAIPGVVDIYGSQDYEIREQRVIDFSDGKIQLFATKKELSGSGCNFQRHCHRAIFVGIDYKFNDFLQAIHRIYRFLQSEQVIIDIIHTESERQILEELLRKWEQHKYLVSKMTEIIKKYGLSGTSVIDKLARTIGVERVKIETPWYTVVNNDCVLETQQMETNSIDLIHTSIPFGNHYEYSASYNDFGHNEDTARFFEQMDHLTPNLLRILKPGRVAAIHVKDRILFGNATGDGMPTVEPFHADCIEHYRKHGFRYMGMITVVTDVVRENNQTYRLGWSEQCKDGTKMGVGCPEYILLFRKLPSDTSKAYADEPVRKTKEQYTRAQWQIDAHAYWRSSGDRLLSKEELADVPVKDLQRVYRQYSRQSVYDYHEHVELAKQQDVNGKLPATFMVVAPGSWTDGVWDDINRMRTLNTSQSQKRREMHVCLARDSLVLTKRGNIPIQDVEVGDMVLTHKGRWRPVQVVANTGVRPVVQLHAHGVPNLILTPDHKLWTRPVGNYARHTDAARKAEPEWIAAEECKGSYVNLKLPEPNGTDNHDDTYWWMVGRWLADGHIDQRGTAIISVGKSKMDHFMKMAGRFCNHDSFMREQESSFQINITDPNSELRKTLLECGHGASDKQLPPAAYELNKYKAAALLEGYLSGDGHYLQDRKRWMATSVSRSLLLGIAMLVQRVYGSIACVYAGRPEREHRIEGRDVTAQQEWVLSFNIVNPDRRNKPFILDDGAWKKVRNVKPIGEVETWCLRVEEDESFTAEGCIVKNCPLQLDIVERIINRYSNPGDVVLDPFGGLMTVPMVAVEMGRKGYGIELNVDYFRDGVGYLKAAEAKIGMPTLFDFEDIGGAACTSAL